MMCSAGASTSTALVSQLESNAAIVVDALLAKTDDQVFATLSFYLTHDIS